LKDERASTASQKTETYISPTTKITGSINSQNSIVFDGKINGDLSSDSDIRITGTIVGNVSGQDVVIVGGHVKGDIFAKGDIKANTETIIVGDVTAQNIDFNGKCRGNFIVEDIVTLRSESLVAGNIRSLTVGMETGAAVRGEIQSTSERSIDENLFEDL
jgi:cytoskeletal protein CcmA (bactofilin family)